MIHKVPVRNLKANRPDKKVGLPILPPARPLPAPRPPVAVDPQESNPVRVLGFRFALVLVFFHFGFIHELLAYGLGLKHTYILLILNLGAIALSVATGGFRRTLSANPSRWWLAFTCWFMIATVFSTYRVGSLNLLENYVANTLSIVLVVAGLTLTLKECYQMMFAVALGCLANVMSGNLFRAADDTRLTIDFSSVANSNDFAAHLLFVMPFVLFILLTRKAKFLKLIAAGVVLSGLYLVANTGSRGALISFVVVAILLISRASGGVRAACLIAIPALILIFAVLLPQTITTRYLTLFRDDPETVKSEAGASMDTRQYLLKTSLRFTLEHPLLGVGPGEFSDIEGRDAVASGRRGAWQVSHNSYTQISSEMGLPGLLLFLGAVLSTLRLIRSAGKKSRNIPQLRTASVAAFCLVLSMVGFLVAILFLSLAYTFYLPFIAGLAIALSRATQREITVQGPSVNTRLPQVPGLPAYPGR